MYIKKNLKKSSSLQLYFTTTLDAIKLLTFFLLKFFTFFFIFTT
jgi:hypothetical protein